MLHFNQLTAVVLTVAMLAPCATPLVAASRKGDKLMSQGKARELKKEWDAALELYEQALSEDPSNVVYRMATERARFQAAQAHIDQGLKIRSQGSLGEALIHFQKAYAINPASTAAEQEIRRTQEMIERERQKAKQSGKESDAADRALTPSQQAKKETQAKIASMLPAPELKPLSTTPITLKMNNQAPKVLFETVGKIAGINVLFDPEYSPGKNISVEFSNSTIEEALNYLGVLTKSYWKPLSANTIFITNDNVTKRRDYEDHVLKVYYLSNINATQELQEIVSAVRSVADIQRLFVYNAQNAIVARAEADRIALADKIIADLDKPRSEVVVDVMVMEASTVFSRKLTAALASSGLNTPISFSPRTSLRSVTTTNTTAGTTTTSTSTSSTSAIPLSNLAKLSTSDYSVVLPDALLQAVLSDSGTRVLQAPQLRSIDNQKATLKIGDRQPTASGSYQSGVAGVAVSSLVNTQFTYIDVGVNVDVTPRVHENNEISMHVEVEISSVNGTVNLGGIEQPIIGQRKVIHDIRMRDGEVNLLGGLMKQQDTKSVTGVPGLSKIPGLRRLFTGESVERNRSELLIALIPHILRRPEITDQNLRGIAVGNATVVKLNYAPQKAEAAAPATPAATPAITVPVPDKAPALPTPATPQPGATAPAVATPAPAAAAPTPAPAAPTVSAPGPASSAAPLVPAPVQEPASPPPSAAKPPAAAPGSTTPVPLIPGAFDPPGMKDRVGPPQARDAAPPTPAVAPARVSMVPPQMETSLSGVVSVNVVLENATDAASAPMQIRFDPKILRLNDVTRGGLLVSDGTPVSFSKNILNDNGTAIITLSRPAGSAGVGGSGTLVTLSFQAVGRGSTVVRAPNLVVRNSKGAAIASASPEVAITVK